MKVLSQENKNIVLDVKDWKILYFIIKNPRNPLSKIAKDCQISRNQVEYRFNQMKEKGLITGFRTIVNIKNLGYNSFHIFLRLNSTKNEEEFLMRLKDSGYVNSIIMYEGKFNYEISIMAKSLEELMEIYHELINGISISTEEILIILKTLKSEVLPKKFFKKEINYKENFIKKEIKKNELFKLDDIDIKILKILSNDASINNVKIGLQINHSVDIVRYRIKKMQEENIIVEFRPAINYNILNLSVKTILLKLNYFYYENLKEFELFLKKNDSVIWSTKTFGNYDQIIYILTEDFEDLHNFFNEIKNQFGPIIKTYELLLAYRQYKYSFLVDKINL